MRAGSFLRTGNVEITVPDHTLAFPAWCVLSKTELIYYNINTPNGIDRERIGSVLLGRLCSVSLTVVNGRQCLRLQANYHGDEQKLWLMRVLSTKEQSQETDLQMWRMAILLQLLNQKTDNVVCDEATAAFPVPLLSLDNNVAGESLSLKALKSTLEQEKAAKIRAQEALDSSINAHASSVEQYKMRLEALVIQRDGVDEDGEETETVIGILDAIMDKHRQELHRLNQNLKQVDGATVASVTEAFEEYKMEQEKSFEQAQAAWHRERAALLRERSSLIDATAVKTLFLKESGLTEEDAVSVAALQECIKTLLMEKAALQKKVADMEDLVLAVEGAESG